MFSVVGIAEALLLKQFGMLVVVNTTDVLFTQIPNRQTLLWVATITTNILVVIDNEYSRQLVYSMVYMTISYQLSCYVVLFYFSAQDLISSPANCPDDSNLNGTTQLSSLNDVLSLLKLLHTFSEDGKIFDHLFTQECFSPF